MKHKTRVFLADLATRMKTDTTDIKEFRQTTVKTNQNEWEKTRFTASGRIKSALLQTFTFKNGGKPVNNYRRLKKAWAAGGSDPKAKIESVVKVMRHHGAQV